MHRAALAAKRRLIRKQLVSSSFPFTFCFVRHPVSWYESFWKYKTPREWNYWGSEDDPNAIWHLNAALNGLGSSDFNTFVRNVISKRPGYVTELYGWYTPTWIQFVGKQERLADDLIKILRILRLDFDEDAIRNEPRANVSPTSLRITWDRSLRDEVEALERAGIVRYGYAQ